MLGHIDFAEGALAQAFAYTVEVWSCRYRFVMLGETIVDVSHEELFVFEQRVTQSHLFQRV